MTERAGPQLAVRTALERVVEALERLDVLDAPSYQVEHALELTYLLAGRRSRALQDLLHGVWLGHPLHPVLVTVPVGAWTAGLVLDALDAAGQGGRGTGQAATTVTAVGVAGAVAAAATGFTDWQHAHDGARRVGLVHATLNSASLALYAWSLVDRSRGRSGRARLTAAAGYAVTVASSYLGGTLSYRHLLGADHSERARGPRTHTAVAPAAAVQDGVTAVDVEGVPVVLVQHEGERYAVGGRCPHMGAPLGEGWLHQGQLVCPWHGSRFDLATGQPTQGPSTASLPCFDVREQDGQLEVRRRAPWRSATSLTTEEEASR